MCFLNGSSRPVVLTPVPTCGRHCWLLKPLSYAAGTHFWQCFSPGLCSSAISLLPCPQGPLHCLPLPKSPAKQHGKAVTCLRSGSQWVKREVGLGVIGTPRFLVAQGPCTQLSCLIGVGAAGNVVSSLCPRFGWVLWPWLTRPPGAVKPVALVEGCLGKDSELCQTGQPT